MNSVEYFLKTAWDNLNRRVRTRKSYIKKNIQVCMTRSDFLDWGFKHTNTIEKLWAAGKRPSINRIDHNGNYSLMNIEIQDFKENTDEARDRRESAKFKRLVVITPNGVEYEFTSIKAAAGFFKLNPHSLGDVYRGSRAQVFGYTVRR